MITLLNTDCLLELPKIADSTIDLVFSDSPFNISYSYKDYNDNKSDKEYLSWVEKWIKESFRILKNTGSFFVCIGDEYLGEFIVIAKHLGFRFLQKITWYYKFGMNCKRKFSRCHTNILWFVKSDLYTFNIDNVRVESLRKIKYNDKRANHKGKVPDSVWEFPRVCGTFKARIDGHGCQMPVDLMKRLILATTNDGDNVVSLFAGTCPEIEVCQDYNRNLIAYEINNDYYNLARKRLKFV